MPKTRQQQYNSVYTNKLKVYQRILEIKMECYGRGYHTPRKKGGRQAFFCCKDECQRQQANKENIVANTPQEVVTSSITSTAMTLTDLQESMARVSLPDYWQAFPGDGVVQWSRMEIGHAWWYSPTNCICVAHSQSFMESPYIYIYGENVPAA